MSASERAGLRGLLRRGVTVQVPGGLPLTGVMTELLGVPPERLRTEVRAIFLNGRPVDDPEAMHLASGDTLALGGALPGLAGIALSSGSPVAVFREEIAARPCAGAGNGQEALVRLKLFNRVAELFADHVLARGIILPASELARELVGLASPILAGLDAALRAEGDTSVLFTATARDDAA